MSLFRIVSFGSIAAALLATGGYAAEQGYAAPTSEQGYAGAPVAKGHVHAGFRRYGMSPELKMLWRKEMSTELKAVAKGQRMSRLRSEWAAMTDQQKTAKVAELRAKWAGLNPKVRQAMLTKLQNKKARGRQKR